MPNSFLANFYAVAHFFTTSRIKRNFQAIACNQLACQESVKIAEAEIAKEEQAEQAKAETIPA